MFSDKVAIINKQSEFTQPAFCRLFYANLKLHRALESSQFLERLRDQPSKSDYLQYLYRLRVGLSIVEPALQHITSLAPFFRLATLDADIHELANGVHPEQETNLGQHIEHLTYLRDYKPHALIAHAALHYYAFLFGGQAICERLSSAFGTGVSLYTFENDARTMIRRLDEALNSYSRHFSDPQIADIRKEIVQAWIFAGDILLTDIRHLVPS